MATILQRSIWIPCATTDQQAVFSSESLTGPVMRLGYVVIRSLYRVSLLD